MTGDEVKKLDVLSNSLVINMLQSSYSTCVLVSEENEKVIITEKDKQVSVQFSFWPVDAAIEWGSPGLAFLQQLIFSYH